MKHLHKIGMIAVVGGMLATVSCSDFSDYNTVPVSSEPSADKTLWENISANPNLSDFAAVLQRVGYDEILSSAHTYTVWAPVNGSFNTDSLRNISDAKVEKEFVRNLIADFAHKESDTNDTTIYMLNEKLLKFGNKNTSALTFDAQRVLANMDNASIFNYPSVNGLLYTVANPATFRYNGYEIISELKSEASKFFSYVQRYERVTLDEENSVKGEIKDGMQHYDDSVMITSNYLTEILLRAKLDNEDSLYTALIPNDEAWDKAYNTISKYYNYIPTIAYQDLSSNDVGNNKGSGTTQNPIMNPTTGSVSTSLDAAPADAKIQETEAYWTDSITRRWITNNLIFSENNRRYNSKLTSGVTFTATDTIYSTRGNYLTHPQNVVDATDRIIDLSNGHARVLNDYPFLPEDTYAEVIKTRIVARCVTSSGSGFTNKGVINVPGSMWQPEDNITTLYYVRADVPDNSSYAPELDFYLEDVLSCTYDIYAVIVPACLDMDYPADYYPEGTYKPYSLRFDINYTDANNKPVAGRFDGETIQTVAADIKRVKAFECGLEKVDTVKLGRMTFPICYSGTSAKPNIKVMHTSSSFLSSTKKKYEQRLRVANIILKPVNENEENANKE